MQALDEHASTKEASKKDLTETKRQDIELWKKWKEGGQAPNDLRPLLKNFRGLIRSKSNRWAQNTDLPAAAVHAEFNKQFVNALRTYDPNKGTKLGSWVTTNLKKAQRWASTYQNPARVQETRYYKIGEFDNTVAQLDEQLGREPTNLELAEALKWSEEEVTRMQKEKRPTLYSSAFEGYDPTTIVPSRESEVLRLIRFELSPEELLVYEYTGGYGGKPKLRPGQIAKKLNMSPSKITRIRNSIANKMKKYL